MADVKVTRSELLKLKKQIKLAQSGHKLLKKKRDGLIMEFFEMLKDARDLRGQMAAKYSLANRKLQYSMALDGVQEIKSLAMALRERPSVELEIRNVMGVNIPKIRHGAIKKSILERGYGLFSTSIRMEEMATAYEDLLEDVIKAAETETKMRKILVEIEKTKRRVNALEFAVIPKLTRNAKFIGFRLEEMEREVIFLMKRMKGKEAN